MNLFEANLNQNCFVRAVNIQDEKTKFRLMELGLVEGCKIAVDRKSVLKKTLLIIFNSACFTLKANLAKEIVVAYE